MVLPWRSGKPFNIRNATTTDHWYNVAIGTSEACVSINLVNKLSRVTVEIYIADNKNLFDYLAERKDEIENALAFPMEWVRLDNKKASRIKYAIPGLNFDDHSNYDALMDKIIEKVIVLKKGVPGVYRTIRCVHNLFYLFRRNMLYCTEKE